MKKVLLLNNVPAPYFNPLFARLHAETNWALTVCYTSAWNRDVGWESNSLNAGEAHILAERWPKLKAWFGARCAAAVALAYLLIRLRPDYLICYGYTLAPQFTALGWALLTGTAFALAGDANVFCADAAGAKRLGKRLWLGLLLRRAAAVLAVGTANRRFWEAYGVRPEKITEAPFAVDNEFFARRCCERHAEAARLRERLGLDGKVVFLFAGRLTKRKNVDLLLRAAARLNDERCAVVIVGAGEERAALEAMTKGASRVVFVGGAPPQELPLYYALADVLVLPARQEPWGLVINEALACGLAVIAHEHVGAAVDLVGPDNGVALRTFSTEELCAALRLLTDDAALRQRMQQRSREKIAAWSIEAAAAGIVRAVEQSSPRRTAHAPVPALEKER
jgi:glycosyltransferase involved in cell wall biosynthesis